VAPIQIGDTKGFGRFYGLKEMGVALLCCAQDNGWPGGVSRRAVGVKNQGSTNETWHTADPNIPNSSKKFFTGGDPGSDYSNVPPLDPVSPEKVFEVYRLGEYDRPGGSGKITVEDLKNPAARIPSIPEMTGPDFYSYVIKEDNWNRTLPVNQPLRDGGTRVQGILLMSLFCPSKGWTLINPDFRLSVDVLRDFGFEVALPDRKVVGDLGFP
jgi:hypothetical protein